MIILGHYYSRESLLTLFLFFRISLPHCPCRSRTPLVRPDSLSIGSSSETDDISSCSGKSLSLLQQQQEREREKKKLQQQQSDADSSTSSSDNDTNKWQNLPKEAWKQAAEVKQYY